MNPGRDLDALVATRVMGETWCQLMMEGFATRETGPRMCNCGAVGFPYEHHKPYSTDIAAAWEVVEAMQDLGVWRDVSDRVRWYCILDGEEVWGNTAPHAICLAALKAVMT